jgi:HKD family nuclease
MLISPFIGPLKGVSVSMSRLVDKIQRERIRTYVITNEPATAYPAHASAVSMLSSTDFTEIRYNPSLHAKCYICRTGSGGFALVGSGNLTETSITQRHEVGMLIFSRGHGAQLVHELFEWGGVRLRSLAESKLVKRISVRR